jgi:hypothetical protein
MCHHTRAFYVWVFLFFTAIMTQSVVHIHIFTAHANS